MNTDKINIIKSDTWKYPPTKNNYGKSHSPFDAKYIIHIKSNLFNEPVILTSDLHTYSYKVFERLADEIDLSKYIVITCGDMAGDGILGHDADPTDTYEFIRQRAKALYVIQGNHDLPSIDDNLMHNLCNHDGIHCFLPDGQILNTTLGKIGGVHGTISNKNHPYKKPKNIYLKILENLLKNNLDILITHDTPSFHNGQEKVIGQDDIYNLVKKYKPKIHIYGHCHHHNFIEYNSGVYFINVDARVLVIN